MQNYPNPFNGTTIIPVNVHQNTKSNVVHEIEIRNILGRIVRRIALYHLIVGLNKVEWDGKDSFGNSIVSGIYFYSLTGAGDKSIKMLYLK